MSAMNTINVLTGSDKIAPIESDLLARLSAVAATLGNDQPVIKETAQQYPRAA